VRSALTGIAGIGDWTASYVAMRALNAPDAFLPTDLILRRAAGDLRASELERQSEAWRPWRAYAVMLLWQAASDAPLHPTRSRHVERLSPPIGSRRGGDSRLVAAGVE
jgi:3-methyladenine DNA glycosylase/8-oxoguanine DNA glycosylase